MASPSVASRSKQISRAADTDDVVMARALEFAAWAKRHARMVMIVAGLAAALVGGLIWYYWVHKPQQAARAGTEFMSLERRVDPANPALAERDLRDFARRFDGTAEADQARLLLAKIHLQANAPKKAVPVLQEVDAKYQRPLGAQAGLLLGAAQSEAGDREAAIRAYLQVADQAESAYYREEALTSAALLRQQSGNYAGAAELWRRLVEGAEEGSLQRSIFEMRLAEAEGMALGKK